MLTADGYVVPAYSLCADCVEAEQAALQAAADAAATYERQLAGISDVHERLVRAAHHFARDPASGGPSDPELRDSIMPLVPEIWPNGFISPSSIAVPWDSEALGAWFASRASATSMPTDFVFHEQRVVTRFGRSRRIDVGDVAGWVLPWAGVESRRGRRNDADIVVLVDGRAIYGSPRGIGAREVTEIRDVFRPALLPRRALVVMAERLGLAGPVAGT